MSEPMLEFREVDVFYGVIQALKQVSLQVNKGETVSLTLTFEKAGEVKVDVHVDKVGAMPAAAGAHAGH